MNRRLFNFWFPIGFLLLVTLFLSLLPGCGRDFEQQETQKEVAKDGGNGIDEDTDLDGLTDSREKKIGTDPFHADSDGDSLGDGQEIDQFGTDPLKADTDGDGLDDGQEIKKFSSNPQEEDSDGDGLKDGQEVEKGCDPTKKDSDGDSFGDNYELKTGTDPQDKKSVPTIEFPQGPVYLFKTLKVDKPAMLGFFMTPESDILLYFDGFTDGKNDQIKLIGGPGEYYGPGQDKEKGTVDDLFRFNQAAYERIRGDGWNIKIECQIKQDKIECGPGEIKLTLGVAQFLQGGLNLTLKEVKIEGQFNQQRTKIIDLSLTAIIDKQELEEAIITSKLLNINVDTVLKLFDPGKGEKIDLGLKLSARKVEAAGFAPVDSSKKILPRKLNGQKSFSGVLEEGDVIDPYISFKQQGISDPEEAELVDRAMAEIIKQESVDMVFTTRKESKTGDRIYQVVSARGEVVFKRVREKGKETQYQIMKVTGVSPLVGVDDPTHMGTYQQELAAGSNPKNTSLSGYQGAEDPRLSFVEPEDHGYPHAYERISAFFDEPRAGDLVILGKPYNGSGGTHGNLDITQSRAPLIVAGPGVRASSDDPASADFEILADGSKALFLNRAAKLVDIAPTVAASLGCKRTTGIDQHGQYNSSLYLKWQDGSMLAEVFANKPKFEIAQAEYAVIIINDGLNGNELLHQVFNQEFNVPNYRRLMKQGVTFRYGAIGNFPSSTLPSHNTIGSGVYSGHHGILDNSFYHRELGIHVSPGMDASYLLGTSIEGIPMETLHETIHRNFGAYHPYKRTGAFTVSLFNPSTRGADFATLDRDLMPSYINLGIAANQVKIKEKIYNLPAVPMMDYGGLVDNSSTYNFYRLYTGKQAKIPKFSITNLVSTDGAGHQAGPHGDYLRTVVERNDKRLEIILDTLEAAGIWEKTLFILTADHGMELQDKSRRGDKLEGLKKSGIKYISSGKSIYLPRLVTQVTPAQFRQNQPVKLKVVVTDLHTGKPVQKAQVKITEGGPALKKETNQNGQVLLDFTPEGSLLKLEITSLDHNRKLLEYTVDK